MKIKWKLFLIYTSLILLILSVSCTIFYQHNTRLMRDNGYQFLQQTSVSISDKLDSEMENLDQLATRLIFSDEISEIWFHSITNSNGALNQTSINNLNSAVYSLVGPNLQSWEICLYHLSGRVASMGMYSSVVLADPQDISSFPLVAESLAADGSKVFSTPYTNPWNRQNRVISVSRCFGSGLLSTPNAVVEVSLKFDYLTQKLKKLLGSVNYGDEIQLQIFTPEGDLIYASPDTEQEIISLYLDKMDHKQSQKWFSFQNEQTGEKMAVSYIQSDYTDWIVVTSLPERILFESVLEFGKTLMIIVFFALGCTTLVSYLVANNLTKPLDRLHMAIENTVLPYTKPLPEDDYHNQSEPEALYNAYMHLTKQLESSIELSAQMQIRETQARLSALQSQMNPHFLYNTLSSISILTEYGEQQKVMQICQLLTDMMGYILSKKKKDTTLLDEIHFAEQYLSLMKIRYEHYLEWEIDIPESMHELPFPKLILQPLVENCMKYATGVTPPWHIRVQGFLTESGDWRIQVTDNGTGFPEEYLEKWTQTADSQIPRYYDESSDGLGIKNTCSRFRILYPDRTVFQLNNLPQGGASILFGSSFPES